MPVAIDLHCHSTISDGLLSPQALVEHAHYRGIKLLALTDHDDVSGLAEAASAAQALGLQFVNGVEISVTWKKRTLHIVGLKINPDDVALKEALAQVKHGRLARAKHMADSLATVGIHGAYEGALAIAGNSIVTRTHFARFLVANGHAKNNRAVFKRYLVKGKPGFINHEWMSLKEAVTLITDSGGVAVIAHPGRYDLGMINTHLLMHEFKSYGGLAIEVVTGSHTPPQYQQYAKIAHRFSLKASLGSDFHGPGISYIDMGGVPSLPAECVPIWADWDEARLIN